MKLPRDKYKLVVISIVLWIFWSYVQKIISYPAYEYCLIPEIDGGQSLPKSLCELFESSSKWIPNIGFALSMLFIWSSKFRNLFNRNKIKKSKDD